MESFSNTFEWRVSNVCRARGVKCFGSHINQNHSLLKHVKRIEELVIGVGYFILDFTLTWEVGEVWNSIVGNKTRQCFLLCVDVDECLRPDVCGEGHCINTAGAFRCEYCDSGYRMTQGGRCEGKCVPCPSAECTWPWNAGLGPHPGLPATLPGTYLPLLMCAWHQLIHTLPAFWTHSLFASLQWLGLDYFPPSHSPCCHASICLPWYLEWIALEQLIAEYLSLNPDLMTASGSFIWEHGAGLPAVDF